MGFTIEIVSATSAGLPTASQPTSAPRPFVNSSTRSRTFVCGRVDHVVGADPARDVSPLGDADRRGWRGRRRGAWRSPSSSRPMMPPPSTSTVAPLGMRNVSRPARQHAAGSVIAAVTGSRTPATREPPRVGSTTRSAKPPAASEPNDSGSRGAPRHSGHSPHPQLGSQATARPISVLANARAHLDDRAAVLMSHDERRPPREQALGRVHVRAADSRRCGPRPGLGRLLERARAPRRR